MTWSLISIQHLAAHVPQRLSLLLVDLPALLWKLLIALLDVRHLVSKINFPTLFVSDDLPCLFLSQHCFMFTSAHQFHPHHSHYIYHSFTLLFQAQNISFSRIFSSVDHWYPPEWLHGLITVQCAAKKYPLKFFCHFLSNRSEFLHEISHIYYSFIITWNC